MPRSHWQPNLPWKLLLTVTCEEKKTFAAHRGQDKKGRVGK